MMNTIGILGAYGNVGTEAARELARHPGHKILLGGRDALKLRRLADTTGPACEPHPLDIEDPRSVAAFCEQCDVVINASRYTDTLIEAVFASGRHLVDTTAFRRDRWRSRHAELVARNIKWIVFTGWIPGLPELVAAYLEAVALQKFGSVTAVDVYVYDCNEYRGRGLLELTGGFFYGPGIMNAVHTLLGRKPPTIGKPQTDDQIRLRTIPAVKFARLPAPAGLKLVMSMGQDPRRRIYLAYDLSLMPAMLASFWYGTTRSEDWLAQHIIGPVLSRRGEQKGVAEILRARATTTTGHHLETTFVETRRDGYWLSGLVPATTARLILTDKITTPGLSTLEQSMDPISLADELAAVGVDFRIKP